MSNGPFRGERIKTVQASTPEESWLKTKEAIEKNVEKNREDALNFKFKWDKGSYDGSVHEETLDSLWDVAGRPFVKQYPPGELMETWKEKYDRPQTFDRAFMTQGKKMVPVQIREIFHEDKIVTTHETEPDTLHVRMGDVSDIIAELPHVLQYKKARENGTLDDLNKKSDEERALHGEARYKIKGTFEHEAHEVIEKQLMDNFINTGKATVGQKKRKDFF